MRRHNIRPFKCATLLLLLTLSFCSRPPYSRGDRFFKKNRYEVAISHYNEALKRSGLSEAERGVLNLKIAKCNHLLGKAEEALQRVRNIKEIKKDHECDLFEFKMDLINDEGKWENSRELTSLYEASVANECSMEDKIIDSFFHGLRLRYYNPSIRKGDRLAIIGHLKLNNEDYISALDYFMDALKKRPADKKYFIDMADTFVKIEERAKDFERKQRISFYRTNYVYFFRFLSSIIKATQAEIFNSKPVLEKMKQLTREFKKARSTRPIPLYSDIGFQDRKNLLQTVEVNEDLKIFMIDNAESSNHYIVYWPEKKLLGFSPKLGSNSFILTD